MQIKLNVKYNKRMTDIQFPCSEEILGEALHRIGAPLYEYPVKLYVISTRSIILPDLCRI